MNKLPSWLKSPAAVWTGASLLLFLVIPWLIVTVIHSDAAMAACLLLFFAIDPVFAIAAGMFAGKRPRELWFLPLLIPALFVLASWTCFEWADPAYFTYALFYLVLCGTTMFVFLIMTNGKPR